MGKYRKTRNLKTETPLREQVSRGLSVVGLLALAAAICAASAAQTDARLPESQSDAPSAAVTASAFTIAPSLANLRPTQPASGPLHKVAAWFHGVASWYGGSFNGRLTANGEVYDMYAMTAATSEFHNKLPLGTKVRVVNSHNGRSVVVRITDRGPLPKDRIIDVSYGAARKLAIVKPGTAYVRVDVLHWGDDSYRVRSE